MANIDGKYLTPDMPREREIGSDHSDSRDGGGTEKHDHHDRIQGQVDKGRAFLYVIFASAIVFVFLPVMILIHELGHAVAIYALGGEVTGYKVGKLGVSITFTGIHSSRDLFIVHLAGVLANLLVGALHLFVVWKYKGHPFREAIAFIWGMVLLLSDFLTYTITDLFYERGGDFEKIYDTYPWSKGAFILLDIILVVAIIYILTQDRFWQGIELPRKPVRDI